MRSILKYILLFLVFSMTCPIHAQSSMGDKLFAEGQVLQKKKQYQKAIAKYKAAKVAYTSSEKKQMCDEQIKLCKPSTPVPKVDDIVEDTNIHSLSITPKTLSFPSDKDRTADVSVLTEDTSWTYEVPRAQGSDSSFIYVERINEGKGLRVRAGVNYTTLNRLQQIIVSTTMLKDTISVYQSGKNVTLRTSENLLEYKIKGGSKSINVITNSDSLVTSNNNEFWYVESKPDWVEANVDFNDKNNLRKGLIKSAKPVLAEDEKMSRLSITVVPLIKSDKEYETGRKGELIIASQSKRYKIIIVQQK